MQRIYSDQAFMVQPAKIQVGDTIDGQPITAVKVGTKYVTVTFAGDRTRRYELTDRATMLVIRRVETEASRKAYQRSLANEQIQKDLDSFTPQAPKVAQSILDKASNYHVVGSNLMESLIAAQAADAVRQQWRRAHEWLTQDRPEEKGGTVDNVEARRIFCDEQAKDLLRRMSYGASRSTSQVQNLMDDYERVAIAKFIDDSRWYE